MSVRKLQLSGLSSSDSALFDPKSDEPESAFPNRASLDFEHLDSSEPDIGGLSDAFNPQGNVFFVEESRRVLSPIRSSPDSHEKPRIRPASASSAAGTEKKGKKHKWKKLLPSALMRRAGKGAKKATMDGRTGKTQIVSVKSPDGRKLRVDSLQSLGIVTGRSKGEEGRHGKGRLVVKGLVPDSLADKTREIRNGDHIAAVNGIPVSKETVNQVLRDSIGAKEISLTVYRMVASQSSGVKLRRHISTATPALIQLFNGIPSANWKMTMSGIPHCVMYLKLVSSEAEDDKDIVYSYPSEDSHWRLSKLILGIRGAFLTLSDMMKEITGSYAESSTVSVGEKLVHVGYRQCGKCLFVLALPADVVHIHSLSEFLDDVCRLLSFLYGSVSNAFESGQNTSRLDHTFSLIFERFVSAGESGFSTRTSDTVHGIPKLYIQPDLLVKVSSVLNDLESDDYSDTLDVLMLRRRYRIHSSCLFYKGYLIDSHMSSNDLADVGLYCRFHCILGAMIKQKLGHVVVWTEVFEKETGATNGEDYRRFLLIVGMANALVCVLLETGCGTEEPLPHPGPDPLYVDLAREVILTLNVRGILEALDLRLSSSRIPSTTQADALVSALSLLTTSRHSLSVGDSEDLARHKKKLAAKGEISSLTKCNNGLLFHYVNVDSVNGVVVAPVQATPGQVSGHIHTEIVRNFHKACISIRKVLKGQNGDKIYEHGTLFQYSAESHLDKTKSTSLLYWVIGRLVQHPVEKEFYVCFQDSVGWSAAEMAFEFAFGAMV